MGRTRRVADQPSARQPRFSSTRETVRVLLKTQHPDLAELPIQEVAGGWDNFIFRLGAEMAIRLPCRLATATLLENERRWLSSIAHRLPVPVPVPLRLGKPGDKFPWPWSIVPWLYRRTLRPCPVKCRSGKAMGAFSSCSTRFRSSRGTKKPIERGAAS